jgi:hypothetical protein
MNLADGLNSTISGNICGSHWTLTEDGTVTNIQALIRNLTANFKARCSIYTYPGKVYKGQTDEVTIGVSIAKQQINFPCSIALTAGDYILDCWGLSGYATTVICAVANVGKGDEGTHPYPLPGSNQPAAPSGGWSTVDFERDIIATYTATGVAVLRGGGHSNAAAFFVSIAVIIKAWLFKQRRKRLVAANVI